MRQMTDNLRGAALMTAAMAAFVVNDTAMKSVTATLPLYTAILLRGVLTVGLLLLVAPMLGGIRLRLPCGDRRIIAWRTLGEVGGTVTFLTALTQLPLANLTAILQSLPLAVTLAAALFLREPVGWRRMLAILVGFAGVLMVVRPGPSGFDIWALLGLASVGFVVLRDLATRQLSPQISSVTVAFYAAVAVTGMAALVVPFTGWQTPNLTEALTITIASTFLIGGYLFIVMAMRVGDVSVVAPLRYTALVFAIVLGWLAFGQLPDFWTLAGATVVVLTGIYAFHRERRAGQRVAAPEKVALRMR